MRRCRTGPRTPPSFSNRAAEVDSTRASCSAPCTRINNEGDGMPDGGTRAARRQHGADSTKSARRPTTIAWRCSHADLHDHVDGSWAPKYRLNGTAVGVLAVPSAEPLERHLRHRNEYVKTSFKDKSSRIRRTDLRRSRAHQAPRALPRHRPNDHDSPLRRPRTASVETYRGWIIPAPRDGSLQVLERRGERRRPRTAGRASMLPFRRRAAPEASMGACSRWSDALERRWRRISG